MFFSGSVMPARDIVYKRLKRVRAFRAEIAAAIGIRVQVNDGMLSKLIGVRFYPLRGTEKAGLFAIPRAVIDGALRSPAGLYQFGQGARFLELVHLAGNRIVGAVDPRIVVIAANNPFVRLG